MHSLGFCHSQCIPQAIDQSQLIAERTSLNASLFVMGGLNQKLSACNRLWAYRHEDSFPPYALGPYGLATLTISHAPFHGLEKPLRANMLPHVLGESQASAPLCDSL